jgi:class 3 adenylate cyclase/pimeloyl-ACP methyl ester carboxylesterase
MAEIFSTRRLAAIMAADMVGYSRLMGRDELDTIQRQRSHRQDLIDPTIAAHNGRIVKTTGDGMLVEFASVVDAVSCAEEIQSAMAQREADRPESEAIRYRIGINLGDIIIEDDDIFGDGVNIAARLETLAEAGGLCVSDVVRQSVEGKLDLALEDMGLQRVKNIEREVHAWRWLPSKGDAEAPDAFDDREQEIRFCTSQDGIQIAYATVGKGPPLVKAPNWMNHLEYDWKTPFWRHLVEALASSHSLLRFDQRGNGLSDRVVERFSLEAYVDDLEAVVDAAGLERFPLLGISQGCAISVAYTIRHPERVSGLVLYGGYCRGSKRRGSEADIEHADAIVTMIRHEWGADSPAFRQLFASRFMPDATPEQMDWFNELQKITVAPGTAARIRAANDEIDITALLPQITVPTLVLHCREEDVAPFEEGRLIAAKIPGARFVPLEGRNHLILENEPAWPRFMSEVQSFLKELERRD